MAIRFESDTDFRIGAEEKMLCDAYVPGIKLTADTGARRCNHIIRYKKSDIPEMICRRGDMTIHDDWGGKIPLDFYHLLYSVCRVLFLEKSLFTVHAACVKTDKTILLAGHSGAGKTSILLELAEKRAARVWAGNKTLVSFDENSKLKVVAGTRTITARLADISPGSGSFRKYRVLGDRAACLPERKYYADGRADKTIQAIVIVRLNGSVREYGKIPPINALHRLYPYFLDTVNADTIMFGGEDVFGGKVSGPEKILAAKLKECLAGIPAYHLSGPMSYVKSKLLSI